MKCFFLAIALSLLVGCGVPKPEPKITSNPIAEVTTAHRPDLPINWFEVSHDNWSYGLPMGFDVVQLTPQFGILSQHHSATRQIDISFTTHDIDDAKDLHQYVFSKFVLLSMLEGKQIIATAENSKNHDQVVLAVQLLYEDSNLSDARRQAGEVYNSSLDFFILKEKTVYHISCFGEASALKKNSDICFKVIDSLFIK